LDLLAGDLLARRVLAHRSIIGVIY
jgi:hypothetical protein